ncbi:MAG: thermonuclease family protein, partial [Dolichospermum sp.]
MKQGLRLGAVMMTFGLLACDSRVAASGDLVERVRDGDTLVLKRADGKNLPVRFACVDAPAVPHSQQEKRSKISKDVNQFAWGVRAKTRI